MVDTSVRGSPPAVNGPYRSSPNLRAAARSG